MLPIMKTDPKLKRKNCSGQFFLTKNRPFRTKNRVPSRITRDHNKIILLNIFFKNVLYVGVKYEILIKSRPFLQLKRPLLDLFWQLGRTHMATLKTMFGMKSSTFWLGLAKHYTKNCYWKLISREAK